MFKTLLGKLIPARRPRRTVFLMNIAPWKRELFYAIYRDCRTVVIPLKEDATRYVNRALKAKEAELVVWGYKESPGTAEFLAATGAKVTRVEDGFVRSFGLGIDHNLPLSLCFDDEGLYYNALAPSRFERLAQNHRTVVTPELLERARRLREEFARSDVTKYNLPAEKFVYPPKKRPRVLVIGQCEGDASIRYSMSEITTNVGLVQYAKARNPDAEIVFKLHPDEASKKVRAEKIAAIADLVIDRNAGINDLLAGVDKVYTISSLLGLEALVRGKEVHVTGMPFYAGWGLTRDLPACPRRTEKLTLDELFALAYLVYPVYYDENFNRVGAEEFISGMIARLRPAGENPPSGNGDGPGGGDKPGAGGEAGADGEPAKAPPAAAKKKSGEAGKGSAPGKPAGEESDEIPDFLCLRNSYELDRALLGEKPVFLYVPWIFNHTGRLIGYLRSDKYELAPLNLAGDMDTDDRKKVLAYARRSPVAYKRYIRSRLVRLKDRVRAAILTFDWAPVSRPIAEVCRDLGVYTVLIPHESVFLNRELYYRHFETMASAPVCDEILAWGDTQRGVFAERGYPADRIKIVGSPKLDEAAFYRNVLSRQKFCDFYGLDPELPIFLFALQNLDSQIDMKAARKSQNEVMADIVKFCAENSCQAIFRMPPSTYNVINGTVRELIEASDGRCVIDYAPLYVTDPAESVWHSAAVISFNSTMLFEAVLMKRHALSVRYIDGIASIWRDALIPVARNADELRAALAGFAAEPYAPDAAAREEYRRMAREFGTGEFDGRAAERIRGELERLAAELPEPLPGDPERFFAGERIDVARIPSSPAVLAGPQKYLPRILNLNTLLDLTKTQEWECGAAQLYFQWGSFEKDIKVYNRQLARKFGRKVVYLEDGFIRSSGIGLSGTPALSVIVDDLAPYYEAEKPTRLEKILNGDWEMTAEEAETAGRAIRLILENRISKYNSAPLRDYRIGREGRKKLLLVDQRYGDMSVVKGLGGEKSFEDMLTDAVNGYRDWDIVVKQHPDAILGGKGSYFNNERLAFAKGEENVFVLDWDINPIWLLSKVDEVFVCSSGMGFEALLAGRKVTCYGVPWYSGWGVTEDRIRVSRRTRRRSVAELFCAAYLKLSRYYCRETDSPGTIFDVIGQIAAERDGADPRRTDA